MNSWIIRVPAAANRRTIERRYFPNPPVPVISLRLVRRSAGIRFDEKRPVAENPSTLRHCCDHTSNTLRIVGEKVRGCFGLRFELVSL
jgi:hypothetical protein